MFLKGPALILEVSHEGTSAYRITTYSRFSDNKFVTIASTKEEIAKIQELIVNCFAVSYILITREQFEKEVLQHALDN